MSWIEQAWSEFLNWLPVLLTLCDLAVSLGFIAWVLMSKPNSTSAVAWCLLILFLPFLGAILFYFFGYQHINRPLKRKRLHKQTYQFPPGHEPGSGSFLPPSARQRPEEGTLSEELARLADRFGAYPLTRGNHIDFYYDGSSAFEAMLEAVGSARHHIHLEFFIFHADDIGKQFLDLLSRQARAGVQVRLLYDAMGSHRLNQSALRPLHQAGARSSVFLPLNPFRRRLQINMRNHRKILVVDGRVGFMGGLNIGDEYLGKNPRFGYWRDTHVRIRGPAVGDLQRVFCEDWDFAADEHLTEGKDADMIRRYFPSQDSDGSFAVQVIDSGPDRDFKSIREIYFAAILRARKRLWIASPYFVPDAGLLDALRLAGYKGVDVRFLGQFHPDKLIPQFAARYYWQHMLDAGVKVYQYTKGMMHSKVVLVDNEWASVGTANLDNRSLHLNFEVNCLIYAPEAVADLEAAFLRDLAESIRLERASYARRPFAARLLENACRLMSPVL
jgi:cardiolipin synthase